MLVDARLDVDTLDEIGRTASRLENEGYAGLWTSETNHDPFLPLTVAAEHTRRVQLGCAIAVAFARNPMTIAQIAHDLQTYSGGRFLLGLGTQVRPHIERRFSMPWSEPAARFEEFVAAVRAILTAWETGEPLAFEGRFYRHTLMTPMFRPEPHGHGLPPIIMAGVGERMLETAGRIADGVLVHAFCTPHHLRTVVRTALRRGFDARSTDRAGFEVGCRGFLVTGGDEVEFEQAREAVRSRIAFYASTPAYRPVLDSHGWGEIGDRLTALSRSGNADRWERMSALVGDEMLETFAVVAEPKRAAAVIARRYAGLADRFWCYTPYPLNPRILSDITTDLERETCASR
ncbi:TIGR03617 family F420-dependent LLM class oxidoreductase [Rhodococcus rhodochrous]|uniref:TIGR03617 family F420-dependent LLM class oxidoreductase n=1 Tax=Rhodococcus rhodochrous TaxID=1829 RepID=UPI00030B8CA0|nr:TIGR03617 family F420-dependent LLM class oxidoreductase [Rhodococcus rhodochrous]